jgi:hypothetical protein
MRHTKTVSSTTKPRARTLKNFVSLSNVDFFVPFLPHAPAPRHNERYLAVVGLLASTLRFEYPRPSTTAILSDCLLLVSRFARRHHITYLLTLTWQINYLTPPIAKPIASKLPPFSFNIYVSQQTNPHYDDFFFLCFNCRLRMSDKNDQCLSLLVYVTVLWVRCGIMMANDSSRLLD